MRGSAPGRGGVQLGREDELRLCRRRGVRGPAAGAFNFSEESVGYKIKRYSIGVVSVNVLHSQHFQVIVRAANRANLRHSVMVNS